MLTRTIFFVFLTMLLMPGPAEGDTLYVTDELEITMRTGPSLQHRVLRMLPSGTSLQVLDESSDWYQIRTSDGREGWVLKRYTTQNTPSKLIARQLEYMTSELQERVQSSEQKAAVLEQENTELQSKLDNMQQELEDLYQKHQTLLKDSGNVEHIKQELQRKSNALALSREELREFEQENQELRSRKNLHWFLAGGGTVFATALLGFILGRIQRNKSRRYYF